MVPVEIKVWRQRRRLQSSTDRRRHVGSFQYLRCHACILMTGNDIWIPMLAQRKGFWDFPPVPNSLLMLFRFLIQRSVQLLLFENVVQKHGGSTSYSSTLSKVDVEGYAKPEQICIPGSMWPPIATTPYPCVLVWPDPPLLKYLGRRLWR